MNNYFSVGQGLWLVENREAVLTTEKHGDLEDIASGKKAYLTPVAIKDNRIASGVDDYSIQVGPNISGHKDKYWIMAPAGGEAFSNDTKFAILAQTPTPLKITCPGATPDSDRIWLDSSEHLVSWRGDGSTPSDKEPEFKAGDNEDDAPLAIGVKSMKRRMVSVAVHQIVSEQPNKPNMPPLLVPTQQHIENELNEAFGWQVNAYFNVTLLPPTNLQFNTATQTTWGYPFADSSAHPTTNNDFLDILTFDHAEIKTITNLRNTNYDINVFLVGGASPFITYGFVLNTSTLKADGTLAGLTNDDIECCVIDADRTWSGYNAWKKSVGGVLDTIAHEVGHVIVGPGHPSDDNGIANLPGTDRTVRLMASGDARVPNGNLLVKDEWDAAEEWLKNRPRGDN